MYPIDIDGLLGGKLYGDFETVIAKFKDGSESDPKSTFQLREYVKDKTSGRWDDIVITSHEKVFRFYEGNEVLTLDLDELRSALGI